MEHADTIREETLTTDKMVAKVEDVARIVQNQGQKAMDQFENLKALIENQRQPVATRQA